MLKPQSFVILRKIVLNDDLQNSMRPGYLILADGTIFSGQMPSWQSGAINGEAVFTTGMTGYVESLTDPSYARQILTFTYPLIGNYGVMDREYWESDRIHAAGVVTSEVYEQNHLPKKRVSFLRWLKEQDVPLLTGVDTRALTKHLRVYGTMPASISQQPDAPSSWPTPLPPQVSIKQPISYNEKESQTILLVDCGLKEGILRALQKFPVKIKRVPHDYDYSRESFDGVVVSNGPGDPTDYPKTITILRQAFATSKPILGICLGSQLMGLAAGAKTYKLKFGHRGHNQPCMDETGKCYVTSQNHGYAVDEKTLPPDWKVTFRNLHDQSVEGIAHKTKPFFSVQFHPEASPGPLDTSWLFADFIKKL